MAVIPVYSLVEKSLQDKRIAGYELAGVAGGCI
jgi:hypothetical protein